MLSPYRILDLTDDRADFAGFLLAQLGAEVVLVEPPGGTATRRDVHHHLAYNRGKRSVVAADADEVVALARSADVVLDCGAFPGVDLTRLREDHPSLITVHVSAFGDDGPKADWPATDLTIAAASGQLALTGDADRPPVRISLPQSWLHGAAEAANGALIALIDRVHSGLGQHVSVSCQQAMMECTQMSMLASLVGAPLYQRCAGGIRIGPYTVQFVYPALDGHVSITFLFGQMIGPFTRRLMEWVHEEGHCSEELRDLDWVDFFNLLFSGRLEPTLLATAIEAIGALTATKTKAELVEQAKRRRLLLAPVATLADVVQAEQPAARQYWDVHGGVRFPGPFAKASGMPLRRLGLPPELGEATGVLPERVVVAPPSAGGEPAAGRRPLEGVKVLDLTWAIAGPMATRVLADWGATVVRIESERRPDIIRNAGPFLAGTPGGIEDTAQWHHPNAGKYSLTLNLSTPEGRDVVRDLVRWADVVTEAFTPKAMRNWGLDYAELSSINPQIIMLSTCLMGQSGPEADFAGFGMLAGAVAGFYDTTGWADRAPAGPFLAYTDYTSPRLMVAALLAALDHRRRSGRGQYIDFSQYEAALHFLSPGLIAYGRDGVTLRRRGNEDGVFHPHGVYPCAGDDRWIAIACRDDTDRKVLAGMVAGDSGDGGGSGAAALDDAAIAAWTAAQPAEALQERLIAAGIAAHQVQNSVECAADPQLAHRRQFRQVPHPVHGQVWVEGPHFALSRSAGGPAWGGPTMGQHNEHVLANILGYDEDRIAELVIADAIA